MAGIRWKANTSTKVNKSLAGRPLDGSQTDGQLEFPPDTLV
jgi:hypothetical protein